ncbi:hypothetical protein N665_2050s0008 [Sinapis alba]|nr:hypothetical protein N665_2050s0008 [Sinapis alba]
MWFLRIVEVWSFELMPSETILVSNVVNKLEAQFYSHFIPFSAFWLRSSVVSVFISLISDIWVIGPFRY